MDSGSNFYKLDRKILYAFYFACLLNIPFWGKMLDVISFNQLSDILFLTSSAAILTAIFYIFFNLVLYRYIEKIIIVTLAGISVFASYSIYNFKVIINMEMIRNIFQTDLNESLDLMSPALVWWFMGLCLIPLSCIFGLIRRNTNRKFWQGLKSRLFNISIAGTIILGSTLLSYKSSIIIFRNNRDIIRTVTPINIFYYLGKYYNEIHKSIPDTDIQPIGLDAQRGNLWRSNITKKTVLVLVIGEAARSTHFSLNGYSKETNPLLKQKQVISLKNVHSCGTSTAVSVPGIFSRLPRHAYTVSQAKAEENLLDILARAKFDISWFDNNSDSKGVAIRFNEVSLRHLDGYDEVLLDKLTEKLDTIDHDSIIVLHQIGSHGPAYYKRYPKQFNQFTPGCETNEIQKCSVAELINTYDNTILYTDYILTRIIDLLEKRNDLNVAMIYISDHGESLGEHGVYLHGAPYMVAPQEQIHIPWIIWLSEQFINEFKVEKPSLEIKAAHGQFSHDNLFHSILGLLNIKTMEYDPSLDIFAKNEEQT